MDKILIYGKGKTGYSLKKLADKHNIYYEIYDDSDFPENVDIKQFSKIVVSPGIPVFSKIYKKAIKNNIPIIGEIEFSYQFQNGKIISITGTDGKSTTTKLIYEILKSVKPKTYIGGNYGIPFSEIVSEHCPEITVLELSSFQTYSIQKFKPDIGIFLNFSKDHLNWHKKISHYLKSKYKMFKNQEKENIAILNFDDENVRNTPTKAKKYYFSLYKLPEDKEGAYFEDSNIFIKINGKNEKIIDTNDIFLKGEHNIQNIMVSVLTGIFSNVPLEKITETIKSFKGLPYRFEYKGKVKGIHFYNDSKATTVQAVEKAVKSAGKNTILIAGGINKGGDFSELKKVVTQNVKHIFLFGQSKDEIYNMLKGSTNIEKVYNLDEAFEKAVRIAKNDDKIVLSPGCASFDFFKNYEERGEYFNKLINKLKSKENG